jgi:hypothetical protein
MAMPCKSSLPEDSHPSVTGIGRSSEDREIRMTTPVSSATLTLPDYGRFARHSGSMGSTVLTSIPSVVGRLSTSRETEATNFYPTVLVLAQVNARTYSVVCFTSRSNEAPSGHPLLKLPSRLKRRVQPCCFVKRGKSSPS